MPSFARMTHLYQSMGHTITFYIRSSSAQATFLLHYQGISFCGFTFNIKVIHDKANENVGIFICILFQLKVVQTSPPLSMPGTRGQVTWLQ